MTSNIMIFFMFSEFIVIPMYFLIMVYDNRKGEKISYKSSINYY